MARWLAWLADRWQSPAREASPLQLSDDARERLCKALRVPSVGSVQELLNCLLLSECAYKLHDVGPEGAVRLMRAVQETLPPGLTTLQGVQCSLPHVHHRYLVAASPKTLYISFMGTKLAKDLLADADFLHRPLSWQAAEPSSAKPAAHRGFLARAKRIPVEQILAHAQRTNRDLLLCGHSLGGAVATLCTLRMLQRAADAGGPQPPVRCVTFGSPAIGNPALAAAVVRRGWNGCFQNVTLPEDLVPRLLALNPDAAVGGAELAIQPQALPPPGPPEAAAASPEPAGGVQQQQARPWQLPRRLWRTGPGAEAAQDSNLLPRRADCPADARESSGQAPAAPPRRFSRRLPLQGWWGGAPAAAADAGASSGEEDGAVEALVEGPAERPGQPEEPGSWLRRLGQLQSLAASAASSVGGGVTGVAGGVAGGVTGAAAALLPSYAHFGRTLVWPAFAGMPAAAVIGDVRARVLSGHRMPAYRQRALAHCSTVEGLPPPAPGSATLHLAHDVLPPAQLDGATADLRPLPPPDSAASPQSWWSWRPVKGGDAQPELMLHLQVEGRELRGLLQGRLLAFGASWCPVRVLGCSSVPEAPPALALALPAPLARLAPRPQAPASPLERLEVEARLPAALAAQVYHGRASGPTPPLELHLRSDFAEAALPVRVRLPTVWLLGSSAGASRRLMQALGAAAGGSGGLPGSLQPAEVVLDGAKWCDLLAAPAATPHLALAALSASLPVPPAPGPLQLADGLLQGLRAWLVGPQLAGRDAASCSAIVLALDPQQPTPPKLLARLRHQADKAGVQVVVAAMGGEAAPAQQQQQQRRPSPEWLRASSTVQLEAGGPALLPAGLMGLRRDVHRALAQQLPQQPRARL